MLAHRHQIAHLQSNFYRAQFYRMMRYLMYSLISSLIFIFLTIYIVLTQAPPSYLANTMDGQILNMPNQE